MIQRVEERGKHRAATTRLMSPILPESVHGTGWTVFEVTTPDLSKRGQTGVYTPVLGRVFGGVGLALDSIVHQ